MTRSFPSGTGSGSRRSSTGRSAQNGRGLWHGLLLRLLLVAARLQALPLQRKREQSGRSGWISQVTNKQQVAEFCSTWVHACAQTNITSNKQDWRYTPSSRAPSAWMVSLLRTAKPSFVSQDWQTPQTFRYFFFLLRPSICTTTQACCSQELMFWFAA